MLPGFARFQGEQNTPTKENTTQVAEYGCLFRNMITAWRAAFKDPDAFFGFVQVGTALLLYHSMGQSGHLCTLDRRYAVHMHRR